MSKHNDDGVDYWFHQMESTETATPHNAEQTDVLNPPQALMGQVLNIPQSYVLTADPEDD